MRKSVLAVVALTIAAVPVTTGTAFADGGGTATPQASAPSSTAAVAQPSASASTAPAGAPSAAPATAQVSVAPSGAPDTGVPPVAAGSGSDATALGAEIGGAVLLAGAGAFALRRRAKARG